MIIAKAAGRQPCVLYDKHHIIPQSIGGPDVESNWIYLTPREHVIAHHCLAKAYPEQEVLNQGFTVNNLKHYDCYRHMMRIKDLANTLEATKKKREVIEKIVLLTNAISKLDIDKVPCTKSGDGRRIRRNANVQQR